jgi:hypothetical protein
MKACWTPIADKAGSKQAGNAQGLKPVDVIGFIGMIEVMPCYKTFFHLYAEAGMPEHALGSALDS